MHRHLFIIVHRQSIGPTGRPSTAKRTWLFGKNINFIVFLNSLPNVKKIKHSKTTFLNSLPIEPDSLLLYMQPIRKGND